MNTQPSPLTPQFQQAIDGLKLKLNRLISRPFSLFGGVFMLVGSITLGLGSFQFGVGFLLMAIANFLIEILNTLEETQALIRAQVTEQRAATEPTSSPAA